MTLPTSHLLDIKLGYEVHHSFPVRMKEILSVRFVKIRADFSEECVAAQTRTSLSVKV